MSIGREPSSSREEDQRSLFTLSPSLFQSAQHQHHHEKVQSPIAFRPSSLLIQDAKAKEKSAAGGRGVIEEKFSARTMPTPARVMVCSAFGKDGMTTSIVVAWFSQVLVKSVINNEGTKDTGDIF